MTFTFGSIKYRLTLNFKTHATSRQLDLKIIKNSQKQKFKFLQLTINKLKKCSIYSGSDFLKISINQSSFANAFQEY